MAEALGRQWQEEVKEMVHTIVEKEIQKLEETRNVMGCQTSIGCVAGKNHAKEHELKWSSDLNDCKGFKEIQEKENKIVGRKMSELTIMMHSVVSDMRSVANEFKEIKNSFTEYKKENASEQEKEWKERDKRIDKYEFRFWAMVIIIVGTALTAMWKIDVSVNELSKVNQQYMNEVIDKLKKGIK